MDSKQEVISWLENGEDYQLGCSLYNQIGKNKILKNLFHGREQTYKTKLRYELCKSAGIDLITYNKLIEGEKLPAVTGNNTGNTGNHPDEIPEIIKRITLDYSTLSSNRAAIHKRMSSIEGNDDDSVKTRKELSDELERLSARIEQLYKAKEDFYTLQILPSEEELYPAELPAKENSKLPKLPSTPDELKEFKKKLQVSLCKDRNLLEYQSETKQEQSSPMPEGPKRTKIEKRIAGKEEIIKNIDFKLVELAD